MNKIMGTINIREARIVVLDLRVLSWPNYLTRSYNMERQNVEPIKEKIIGIVIQNFQINNQNISSINQT